MSDKVCRNCGYSMGDVVCTKCGLPATEEHEHVWGLSDDGRIMCYVRLCDFGTEPGLIVEYIEALEAALASRTRSLAAWKAVAKRWRETALLGVKVYSEITDLYRAWRQPQ